MVAINFQKQFANQVKNGQKTQTIRTIRKAGNPTVGCNLQLYTGMRTKYCQKLGDAICTDVIPITLNEQGIILDGVLITNPLEMARADGFTDCDEMSQWFEKTHGLPFTGNLIKWTIKE